MPRVVTGTCSKAYCDSEEFRAPYYGSAVADAQPKVTKIYAKVLKDGQIVVFGEYELMLAFTYTDALNKKTCFLSSSDKTFCELIDAPEAPDIDRESQTDVMAEAVFTPKVTCSCAKKTGYIWDVEVAGTIEVTLTADSGSAAEPEEAPEKEDPPAEQPVKPARAEGKCLRLGQDCNVPFDTLFQLEPDELDKYAKRDDYLF